MIGTQFALVTSPGGQTGFGAFSGLSAQAQLSLARAQVDAAKAHKPLMSLSAEVYDSTWMQHPTNNLGAYLRVAYWLGAGARPTTPGGPANFVALGYAEQALAYAQAEYNKAFVSANLFGTEDGQVDQILANGESQAKKAKRVDIAAILNQLRGLPVVENQGWLEWVAGSPEARGRLLAGYSTIGAIATVLLIGGVAAWVLLPVAVPVAAEAAALHASRKRSAEISADIHKRISRVRERIKR